MTIMIEEYQQFFKGIYFRFKKLIYYQIPIAVVSIVYTNPLGISLGRGTCGPQQRPQ